MLCDLRGKNLVLIDFHTHISDGSSRTIENARAHIAEYGGGRSVLLPLAPGEATASGDNQGTRTEVAIEAFDRFGDEVIPFCNVGPLVPDALDQIRRYHATGKCKGFGEYKVRLDCDHPASMAIYRLCGELGWPVVVHFEYGEFAHNFEDFGKVVEACPETTFVGHAISWWSNVSAEVNRNRESPDYEVYPTGPVTPGGLTDRWLDEYPNLYADLSARSGYFALSRDPDFGRDFVRRHRPKLLWGTDCPCLDGKGTLMDGGYRDCLAGLTLPMLRDYCESEEHFEDITWHNAARILGL